MAKRQTPKCDPKWVKAKALCRLNMEDIGMAKALGMSPKALMKNNPSPAQRWKLPVKHWIRELYEKRFGHKNGPAPKSRQPRTHASGAETVTYAEGVPF
jgi:hypothetical protein